MRRCSKGTSESRFNLLGVGRFDVSFSVSLRRDRDQFNFENQRGVRADVLACTLRAISEIWRHKQLPFRTNRHQLQRLAPALDHFAYRKRHWFAALVGTVKLFAFDQRAAIVASNLVGRGWLRPG